jgi:hypothetical protein
MAIGMHSAPRLGARHTLDMPDASSIRMADDGFGSKTVLTPLEMGCLHYL